MDEETGPITLLRTKLHRPSLPADHVRRAGLLERLTGAGPCDLPRLLPPTRIQT